jgi:hypothetical protein
MGERRNAYRLQVGKPGGKRPLRRARRRWVGNIKNLGETEWDKDKWRTLVNAVMNLRVP